MPRSRRFLWLLPSLLLLLLAPDASAQIGLRLDAKFKRYLRYEKIDLTLLIHNYSGNTLIFGGEDMQDNGKLSFTIDTQSRQLVSALDPTANPLRGIILRPGERRELTLTLNALYDLQREDVYTVCANIEHARLPNIHQSEACTFEVREGTRLLEKNIGLPAANDSAMIASLQVSLMLFNDGIGTIYCLRAEDDEHVYGTFRIGPYISGSKPQMDADSSSAIHVLVQVRPRLYSYAIYSMVAGEVKLRQQQYYVSETGIPTLSRDTGYLKVLYGRLAREGVDYELRDDYGNRDRAGRRTAPMP
jgi:hypothetical protein